MNITTVDNFDTEYSADSIEWCPHADYKQYFVCGTYQLAENAENADTANDVTATATETVCQRKGRIYLFRFDRELNQLFKVQQMETAAILDMRWLPHDTTQPILATANALGQVEIYELQEGNLMLKDEIHLNRNDDNLLALSLDWEYSGLSNSPRILVSDSRGDITILQCTTEFKLEKVHSWSAHGFEAWICAFDKWDQNRVYTGGDDTLLHAYDLRTYQRVLVNKSHSAGVTCLLSHAQHEHLLLTGSYDENLRTFDTRFLKQPLHELNLGGGIWRLKADPLQRDLILAACMYHNFSIVSMKGSATPELVGTYSEHKSICYGADWCQDVQAHDTELLMATCSFYDHKLCVASTQKLFAEPSAAHLNDCAYISTND